jgi:hypothetical protein
MVRHLCFTHLHQSEEWCLGQNHRAWLQWRPAILPVLTIICHILHLRHCNASPDTPLAAYFFNQKWCYVGPCNITNMLHLGAAIIGPTLWLPLQRHLGPVIACHRSHGLALCTQVDIVLANNGGQMKCSSTCTSRQSL